MAGEATKRLFVGTFLGHDDQQRLSLLQEKFAGSLAEEWHCRLRWVRSDKLHLTWVFIGDVDADKTVDVQGLLQSALQGQKRQQLVYDKLMFWPNARRPRQLVLAPDAVPDQVPVMAELMKRSLKGYLQKDESRAYKPHITLLRFGFDRPHDKTESKRSRGSLEFPSWLKLNEFVPVTQSIEEIALIESHLGRADGAYEALFTAKLI